ncbi:MAG: alpha-glucosidase C-terminal domain-containing protein [Flavobacteriales bacterium]|nr:alpha-glucosidase C-terminal domain-containing protein [Flavobacteriales bacterium]
MKRYLLPLFALFILGCVENQPKEEIAEKETSGSYVKTTPEWSKNATIYEVNLRQFSPGGTFKEFEKEIPRLKEMGIDILWLMPIHPIGEKNRKGTLGSYYSVKDYKAVNPDHGTLDDFKSLVNTAHELEMKVIIDWVANHTAFDNVSIDEGHIDWYTPDSTGNIQPPIGTDWWDVADLNYDNKEMRLAMIDALKFWVEECDIDGYRCDVADWVPTDFWNEARVALDEVKPVFMLAEAENPELHEKAFDMSYGWHFHFVMNEIYEGKKSVKDIREYLGGKAKEFPEGAYRLHFTSNHDENSWKGYTAERLGDAVKTFAVLSATMEGMPLVYNGQEASLAKRLEFFEKDTIDWSNLEMAEFYKKILQLNHNNKALWNGSYGGEIQIVSSETDTTGFAFVREKDENKVLCIFNFSGKEKSITLENERAEGVYKELFSGKELILMNEEKIRLEPWGYRVYIR